MSRKKNPDLLRYIEIGTGITREGDAKVVQGLVKRSGSRYRILGEVPSTKLSKATAKAVKKAIEAEEE